MNEQLKDILDLPILQKMLDSLWCASGIPLGIIGVNGDEVLVETGWQELCRQYHCKHPEIGQRCLLSWLASRESGGGEFADRKPFEFVCDSGLINIGQPIYYEDHYLGILFVGQLLYASPDVEFFRQNALRCGFDPAAYLKLLAEVPVIQREKAQEYLAYHAIQMQLLIEAGMRKLQEEKVRRNLEESEQTFRSLFENANDGIVIAALDGTILEMNPSICRQLGFSHDELVGCNLSSLTDASIQAQIPERIAQVLSERSALFESMLLHKSGRPVPIEINARLINYHGRPALLGNIRDLSERKQAEKELQQSENRFRTIFETAADNPSRWFYCPGQSAVL
jgi:PAS domain S-box-containing protein